VGVFSRGVKKKEKTLFILDVTRDFFNFACKKISYKNGKFQKSIK